MGISSLNKSVNLMLQAFDSKKATEPLITLSHDKPECREVMIKQPFERATPESVGVSSNDLSDFILKLKNDKTLCMHTIMVIKDKKVIFESGFGVYSTKVPHCTFSACKSVTSLAIGILASEGKLRLSDKLYDIFPQLFTPISRLKLRDLTIKDLLTMRSTVTFAELNSMLTEDWLKGFINSSTKGTIGQTFAYNSMNTYVLSAIVCKITGESMTSFLDKKLFAPLGITNYFWEKCPNNIEKGGWGLYICPEDFAKLGQLLLDDGVYGDRQIISKAYVDKATSPLVPTSPDFGEFDYGFQMWSGRKINAFLFNGMFGQNVLCFKDSNIIIVTNAGNNEMFQQSNYFKYVNEHFNRPFNDSLPKNPESDKIINDTIEKIVYSPKPVAQKKLTFFQKLFRKKQAPQLPLPQECYKLTEIELVANDKECASLGILPYMWQLVENNYSKGFSKIAFEIKDDEFYLKYCELDETYRINIGFNDAKTNYLVFHGEKQAVKTLAKFSTDEDGRQVLIVDLYFIEIPCSRQIKIFFEDETDAFMTQTERPNSKFGIDLLNLIKEGYEQQPIIGGKIQSLELDYVRFRMDKMFSPKVYLKIERP